MEIGFIGLGAMGSAMAANLVKAGHRVRAWDRSDKGGEGLTIVGKPADTFQADVVFTMLSDDPAIREVLLDAGVLDTAREGLVHVVMSTISVAFAGEFAAAHEKVATSPRLCWAGRTSPKRVNATSLRRACATPSRKCVRCSKSWARRCGTWVRNLPGPTPPRSPPT